MSKPRMTIAEVCDDMRSRGMSLGHKTLSNGIVSGLFPFGTLIGESAATGRRTFMILRRDYEKWANENLGPAIPKNSA